MKKVLSLILVLGMLSGILPVSAANTANAAAGAATASVVMTGRVHLPDGYVYNGRERLDIYISQSYESSGYVEYTSASMNRDGTYTAYIPRNLTGNYAVSAYIAHLSGPAISDAYNCDGNRMIAFSGKNVSGVNFTVEEGYTVSGQITLGEDAVLENGTLHGWVCAYPYEGERIDMETLGEGNFNTEFSEETGTFAYELTIPKDAGEIVVAVCAAAEPTGNGTFVNNILSDYVYYAGETSSTDYTKGTPVLVNRDISGVDMQLATGTSFSWRSTFPSAFTGNSAYAIFRIEDKETGAILAEHDRYLYWGSPWWNAVLDKEYENKEVYFSYDLQYNDTMLYTEPLYINPDGSCVKTKAEAVPHVLNGTNAVAFTAGLKADFTTGIKGKITFAEDCVLDGSFYCTIVAENTVTGNREYTYITQSGKGEYGYLLTLPEDGTYRVWAEFTCYDENSNVSECNYYYTEEGMAYKWDNAAIIDTSVKNTGIDFRFQKTKTLKGKIVTDGELLCQGEFKPEFTVQSENGNDWSYVTPKEDGTFEVQVPVSMQGECTAYLNVKAGSNIVPGYYHYTNESGGKTFDPDAGETLEFHLTTGKLIQGKIKLPAGVTTNTRTEYVVSLAKLDDYGYENILQNVTAIVKGGETEGTFLFAVPKDSKEEYILCGQYSGSASGIFDGRFYYTGTEKSSIDKTNAAKVSAGAENLVFAAMKGEAVTVSVSNSADGTYASGSCVIDFGDSSKNRYFYLDPGENTSGTLSFSEEHIGREAYVYYRLDGYNGINLYVNPDGSITNKKKAAKPHTITPGKSINITLSTDSSLFEIPSVKGILRVPETVCMLYSDGTQATLDGTLYLYKDGFRVGYQGITVSPGAEIPFDFEVNEIGEYTIGVYLSNWSCDTNLVCNQYMYYAGDGWSEDIEDAKVIENETEQTLQLSLPELPVLTGKVIFGEGTYLEEQIRYEVTYTSVETEETTTAAGYITEAKDFEYKATGLDGVEDYYVSVRFGYSYSRDCDTNIPYGKTYYYTENGLTTDETATRKVVKITDSITLTMPVAPTIRGTITFPEGAYLTGEGSLYLSVRNESGQKVASREYTLSELENIPFALGIQGDGETFSVSVSFGGSDCETNIESGGLYYTKYGMTGDVNREEHYALNDLSNLTLALRQKRYVTGKLIAEDLVNYDDTLSARVEIHPEGKWMYRGVEFDDQLNYKLEIPSEVEGEFSIGFSFYEEGKNNIVKEEFYYYTDSSGEKKNISFPGCNNIDIVAETGYVFSGKVKLPTNAVIYENQEISGTVCLGSNYRSAFRIPYGAREGEFFMVIPKSGYTGYFCNLNGYQLEEKSENLYPGQVYYKDNNTSVVRLEEAKKVTVDTTITDAVLMLLTGEVYTVAFTKPATITTSEQISLFGEIGSVKLKGTVTVNSNETEAKASVVVPGDYNGQQIYLYYDLENNKDNGLYREHVYLNPNGSLVGSKTLAQTFEVGTDGGEYAVTLAKEQDIAFPQYLYRSPYPYKDYAENQFHYEYTEGTCDYLKVTFAEETYFASPSYSYRDYLTIEYGDGLSMGPYYTDSLAGKTVNIPGNSFTAYITERSDQAAFGFAIRSIEPKKYILETEHPYTSETEKVYPYTHPSSAEGLRLHFSEDTDFSGSMKITYTQNGESKELYKQDYNLAGKTIDVRGNSFTITMPKSSTGSYYGFTIVEIEELEYCDVSFLNYDGTVLYQTEIEKGDDAYYSGNTPKRERDEDYIYTFEGWDKSLENIQEDAVFTAQFRENPYATVQFKNSAEDEEPLYIDYVILGKEASFAGEIWPVKPTEGTTAYLFTGWNGRLSNIREDTILVAEFEECDVLVQSTHPYEEEETKTYTYEDSADSITLYFSSDSMVDEEDELIIYDEQDRVRYSLSGSLANEGYTIPGKTAKMELVSNQGGSFGYALAKVVPMWHRFSDWDMEEDPTCEEEGYESRWCRNCYEEEQRAIPALGHSFGVWEKDTDGTMFRACIRCPQREIFEGNAYNLGVVNITVVDGVTMKPIPNATLTTYDENGNEALWHTNEEGVASQVLPLGTNNLVVFSEGYGMRNISVQVTGGVTDVPAVALAQRPPLECKLEAKIMDMEEIKAAGIDVTDPANSHVYKYRITLGFAEKIIYFNKDGNYIKRDGGVIRLRDDRTGENVSIHPVNDKYYLVIYGQSKWLKEMFDVELVAMNTSNTDRIENLVAELEIPEGLSLAAMNTVPQSDVQNLGNLAGGESKSVHWYLRGDQEGEYSLSAKLTGTWMPFGEQFGYEYTTEEPVKVYAGSALNMNIVIPSRATYGEDYPVRIEIENVSDRSVYNLSNSIDKILQSKFLSVNTDGFETYFEENALGYVAVDELKPGEKIVAELKSNILFESNLIKDKIATLADRLKEETDVLAVFNSFKATLDFFNDNYDILDKAWGHVSRGKDHLSDEAFLAAKELESVLGDCKRLVKTESSSRAMYFINRLKQENTMEELVTLSMDTNFYTVWSVARIRKLSDEMDALCVEARDPENCSDYDIYEDVKKVIRAVPVSFWFRDLFVTKLEGSTTTIPYTVTMIPSEERYATVTNISNYYYNLLTNAIDRISQPWYTEIMGEIRDPEGVASANEIIQTDVSKSLTFAVTDVSGDTRFHAWVEGEDGKRFSVSSSAEGTQTTEGGVTFTGPAYLTVHATDVGRGTLYVEEVSEAATFATRNTNRYAFAIEAVESHTCASNGWITLIAAYDDKDGYEAKYCDVCHTLMDVRTVVATDDCTSGSYRITEEVITTEEYRCKLVFDEETPARSAVAIALVKDAQGRMVSVGKDEIKIKPSATIDVTIPLANSGNLQPKLLLWDSLAGMRPVARLAE